MATSPMDPVVMDAVELTDDPVEPLVEAALPTVDKGEDTGTVPDETTDILVAPLPAVSQNLEEKDVTLKLEKMESCLGQLTCEIMEKESLIAKLEKEVVSLKSEVVSGEEKCNRITGENAKQVADLKRRFLAANKEKENMVVKFAMREKDILISSQKAEVADKKMKQAMKERDYAVAKMDTAVADKVKYQMVSDSRLQDVNNLRKEVERWKEEVKAQEAKAACHASRLKAEADAHRETREKLDSAMKHLSETKSEIEKTRRECQDFMEKFEKDDAEKQRLEIQRLRRENAKVIVDVAVSEEISKIKELNKELNEENRTLSEKIQTLEQEIAADQKTAGNLKKTIEEQKADIDRLLGQVADIKKVKSALEEETEARVKAEEELKSLGVENEDLGVENEKCRSKEVELLSFTQKLTEKNAVLQSDLAASTVRSDSLEQRHKNMEERIQTLEDDLEKTSKELKDEKRNRLQETGLLAKKLAEKTAKVELLSQQTLDAENEVQVLKRKHAAGLRELTRELQNAKLNGLDNGSRASSSTSINAVESGGGSSQSITNLTAPDAEPTLQIPPEQALIDKVIRLQRNLARKQEKIEFMEEHVSTLLEEVKKKNRLIQHYVLKTDAGTLSSSAMDETKVVNFI